MSHSLISTFGGFLGRLSLKWLPHDPITASGAIMLAAVPIAVALFITYTKRWKWIYREWLPTETACCVRTIITSARPLSPIKIAMIIYIIPIRFGS